MRIQVNVLSDTVIECDVLYDLSLPTYIICYIIDQKKEKKKLSKACHKLSAFWVSFNHVVLILFMIWCSAALETFALHCSFLAGRSMLSHLNSDQTFICYLKQVSSNISSINAPAVCIVVLQIFYIVFLYCFILSKLSLFGLFSAWAVSSLQFFHKVYEL